MNMDDKRVDIHKYYRKIIRRRYLISIPFIIIVFFSVYYAIKQKPLYESSTTILVAQRRLMSDNLSRLVQRVDQRIRLDILMRVILSQTNLSRLVRTVNLKADRISSFSGAAKSFNNHIQFSASNTASITCGKVWLHLLSLTHPFILMVLILLNLNTKMFAEQKPKTHSKKLTKHGCA